MILCLNPAERQAPAMQCFEGQNMLHEGPKILHWCHSAHAFPEIAIMHPFQYCVNIRYADISCPCDSITLRLQ